MSIQDQPAQADRSKPAPSPTVQTSRPQEQLTVVDTATTTDQVTYPSGLLLWMVVASCCTVSFLHGLDLTIVAATVPDQPLHDGGRHWVVLVSLRPYDGQLLLLRRQTVQHSATEESLHRVAVHL